MFACGLFGGRLRFLGLSRFNICWLFEPWVYFLARGFARRGYLGGRFSVRFVAVFVDFLIVVFFLCLFLFARRFTLCREVEVNAFPANELVASQNPLESGRYPSARSRS